MKRLLTVIILIVCIVSLSVVLFGCGEVDSTRVMIGTNIRLQIKGRDAGKAEKEIYQVIDEVDKTVSTNVEGSDINRINNAEAGSTIELDNITNELIEYAYKYYLISGGVFDISVFPLVEVWKFSPETVSNSSKEPPSQGEINNALSKVGFDKAFEYDAEKMTITKKIEGAKLDLGAVAKGYLVNKSKEIFDKYDIDYAIADIGGSLCLYGDKTFRVGITNPRRTGSGDYIKTVIEAKNTAVVTSGDYERYYFDKNTGERYHHIIDPRTGRPAKSGVISATVVSSDGTLNDILATTIVILGEEDALKLLANDEKVDRVIIMTEDASGNVTVNDYTREEIAAKAAR